MTQGMSYRINWKALGVAVRDTRYANGLLIAELSDKLCIGKDTISRIERGIGGSTEHFLVMCKYCSKDPFSFLEEKL